jgi:hypothetical protein
MSIALEDAAQEVARLQERLSLLRRQPAQPEAAAETIPPAATLASEKASPPALPVLVGYSHVPFLAEGQIANEPFQCHVDEIVKLEPGLSAVATKADEDAYALGGRFSFVVEPPLPPGLSLCPRTGLISGCPEAPCDTATYVVSVQAKCRFELTVAEPQQPAVTIGFAERIEAVEDVAHIGAEPSRLRYFGDWMIWMVHRAYLNDPSLVEIDFSNMHMPFPHEEKRIAPKLMKALKWNSHIQVLLLTNANLQPASGFELAEALAENKSIRVLDIECNFLDSSAVRDIAAGIGRNRNTQIEQLMTAHQKQCKFFGRPTEEAFAQMMSTNDTIVKLGLECDDANWRNQIESALLRNNDMRRRSKQSPSSERSLAPLEERLLKEISLCGEPNADRLSRGHCADDSAASASTSAGASEADEEDVAEAASARLAATHSSMDRVLDYVARYQKLPSFTQLQNYVRNAGAKPPLHREAMPMLKECRGKLLDAALLGNVAVTDAFGTVVEGVLRSWSERNDAWTCEVCTEDGRRYGFQSRHAEPAMAVSESWAAWLHQ